jgi:hypothetical protein
MEKNVIKSQISTARTVGNEDLQVGDYVAVLGTTYQFPTFFWCDTGLDDRRKTIEIEFIEPQAVPLRVKKICLPFVFAMDVHRNFSQLDVRRMRLAVVSPDYAETVWRSIRRARDRHEKKIRDSMASRL